MTHRIVYDFDPQCVPHGNTKNMELGEDWYYYLDNVKTWIPKGWWYDGASIPFPFWWIIGTPQLPQFWGPSLFHDFNYTTHLIARDVADEGFYQLLIQKGISTWRAKTMWASVRTGGYFAYQNSQEDIEELARMKSMINLRPDGYKFIL